VVGEGHLLDLLPDGLAKGFVSEAVGWDLEGAEPWLECRRDVAGGKRWAASVRRCSRDKVG